MRKFGPKSVPCMVGKYRCLRRRFCIQRRRPIRQGLPVYIAGRFIRGIQIKGWI